MQFVKKLNWDFIGMATSIACAIHCAILPLLITSLPFFGIDIIKNIFFEWGMIAVAFLIGSIALRHGYKHHHKKLKPLLIFTMGFIFLILKEIFNKHEFVFLIPAVLFILYAHFLNFRYCNHQKKCDIPAH